MKLTRRKKIFIILATVIIPILSYMIYFDCKYGPKFFGSSRCSCGIPGWVMSKMKEDVSRASSYNDLFYMNFKMPKKYRYSFTYSHLIDYPIFRAKNLPKSQQDFENIRILPGKNISEADQLFLFTTLFIASDKPEAELIPILENANVKPVPEGKLYLLGNAYSRSPLTLGDALPSKSKQNFSKLIRISLMLYNNGYIPRACDFSSSLCCAIEDSNFFTEENPDNFLLLNKYFSKFLAYPKYYKDKHSLNSVKTLFNMMPEKWKQKMPGVEPELEKQIKENASSSSLFDLG